MFCLTLSRRPGGLSSNVQSMKKTRNENTQRCMAAPSCPSWEAPSCPSASSRQAHHSPGKRSLTDVSKGSIVWAPDGDSRKKD